ncbi:MAG TPA: DUF2304 domain-containing protein [Spirochaetota bacterium]|nr:DUF2304 domain-containing protein [Spirochaetota bacterium]
MTGFTVNSDRVQWIGILFSIAYIAVLLVLIHRKKIKEEYSLLWLFSGVVFLIISIWSQVLFFFSFLIGIAYPPAALFLIMILAVISILIHYSMVISKMSDQIKILVQEQGLLRMELDRLRMGSDYSEKTGKSLKEKKRPAAG